MTANNGEINLHRSDKMNRVRSFLILNFAILQIKISVSQTTTTKKNVKNIKITGSKLPEQPYD